MTGPEHYSAAERLIKRADDFTEDAFTCEAKARQSTSSDRRRAHRIEANMSRRIARRSSENAQVHAILALAAATAWPSQVDGSWSPGDYGTAAPAAEQ